MDQNPIQKPAHPPPRTKTRVIIGSSQIKRTAPHAANSTQNRNFNQVTTSTGGDSSTNTQSTNTRHNWNSNKASSKQPIRANQKNARLPPPASMISSNLRAVAGVARSKAREQQSEQEQEKKISPINNSVNKAPSSSINRSSTKRFTGSMQNVRSPLIQNQLCRSPKLPRENSAYKRSPAAGGLPRVGAVPIAQLRQSEFDELNFINSREDNKIQNLQQEEEKKIQLPNPVNRQYYQTRQIRNPPIVLNSRRIINHDSNIESSNVNRDNVNPSSRINYQNALRRLTQSPQNRDNNSEESDQQVKSLQPNDSDVFSTHNSNINTQAQRAFEGGRRALQDRQRAIQGRFGLMRERLDSIQQNIERIEPMVLMNPINRLQRRQQIKEERKQRNSQHRIQLMGILPPNPNLGSDGADPSSFTGMQNRMRNMTNHIQTIAMFLDFYMNLAGGLRGIQRQVGVPKTIINQFPCRLIDVPFLKNKGLWKDDTLSKCMICLEEYCHNEQIRTLPCIHYFHKGCVDEWLSKGTTCPMCKFDLLKTEQTVEEFAESDKNE